MEETGGGMESVCSILIKHLPEAIPHETLFRLFSHYGAASVRPCTSSRLRNCAFVDFKNVTLASQAQQQLNGLRFLGKVLLVERCTKQVKDVKVQKNDAQIGNDFTSSMSLMKESTGTRDLIEISKSGALPASVPIAAKLGVDYEFPPQLEYAYPPPDGNILTNIVNALIAVPHFYTQVLHLMNKMNIPAPFRMALPTPPLPPSVPAPAPPPPPASMPSKPNLEDLSSDESEMESSDEDVGDKNAGVAKSRRKRIKREAIVGPAIDKGVAHEAVGLKSATLVPKEIPLIKKKNPVLQIRITPKPIQKEHIEDSNMEGPGEPDIDDLDPVPYATAEDLQSGKLPPEEILSLPMFKNYTAGQPASVLYLKNLSKDVVVDDLYFIFGSLFGSLDAAKSGLSCVKLMQEGRMRGQAFVTFPSVELAHQALNLAHGYVFKGKPMIIQFGRNPGSAKVN